MKRTFIDAGVLIAAARGEDAVALRAMTILDDPDREFVSSEFVRLEVLPKAVPRFKLVSGTGSHARFPVAWEPPLLNF